MSITGKFIQKTDIFLVWAAEQVKNKGVCLSVLALSEYSRNMENTGIPAVVKLMNKLNVNITVAQDSFSVCHTWAKNNIGHWQQWNPNAVYNRDQSSSFMNYSAFSY